ncbi:hypothetical protein [Bradyrhizobium sp. BWA-3-5]|uniref:hypothetical protein n=1 Tax=Bradyrhizobium sp. BWA-3-5 TaxID=3080013 RepID=UPI003979E3DD
MGVHAGEPRDELRQYLGMGLARLDVIATEAEADPVPALCAYLDKNPAPIVLAGSHAETGNDTGLLPYLVAPHIGATIIPGIVTIAPQRDGTGVTQTMTRGRQRELFVQGRALFTVGRSGPPPPQIAWARARRGQLNVIANSQVEVIEDLQPKTTSERPARHRPKRIGPVDLHTRASGGALTGLTADEAACMILDYLEPLLVLPQAALETKQEKTNASI